MKSTPKNKRQHFFAKIIGALLLLMVGTYFLIKIIFAPPFVKYRNFGIMIPTGYSIHGIDVSHHQNTINWNLVKEMQDDGIQLEFAFIKATEGSFTVDNRFRRNWVEAKEAGMVRGAYHFFIPTRSGAAQAKNFIETVLIEEGDMAPVLDVEKTLGVSTADIQKEVREWLVIVEAKYGMRPIIYSNVHFYETYLAGAFDDYPLWVAHYFANGKPRIQRDWAFWQHSESGRVNGIKTNVDFNVFSGGKWAFAELIK
jgi:lysozyme